MMQLMKKLCVLLLSIFVSLIAVELVLSKVNLLPDQRIDKRLKTPTYLWNKDTIVDDEKFHEEEIFAGIKEEDFVIVAMGDSFTEGYPVKFEDQYTEVLRRNFNDKSVKVINLGFGNTGPDQHLKFFQKYILPRFTPDLVVWQFYPNDIWDNLHFPLFILSDSGDLTPLDGSKNWLYRSHLFYSKFSFLGKLREKSTILKYLLAFIEKTYKYQEIPGNIEDKHSWSLKKIAAEMKYMNQLATEKNFTMHYALIAPQLHYHYEDTGSDWVIDDYQKLYETLAKEKNFIDVNFATDSAELASVSANLHVEIFSSEKRDPNPYGDRHFNEAGYAKMAELIYQKIVQATLSTQLK